MNHDINRPINEIGRIVIHLPDDAMFYRDRSYLPVVIDMADGEQLPKLLRSGDHGINYMAQYEIFSSLCSDRAQMAVDQRLLVAGMPVTPERYLGMWRTAIAASLTPADAALEHGIQACAILRAPLAELVDAKSSWTSCPFGTFERFQAKFGDLFELDEHGTFSLELDLATPGHARAAYYAASMMCSKFDRSSVSWRACIEIRQVGAQRHQSGLFEIAEA